MNKRREKKAKGPINVWINEEKRKQNKLASPTQYMAER